MNRKDDEELIPSEKSGEVECGTGGNQLDKPPC